MAAERRRIVIDASLALSFAIPAQPYHAQASALLQAWAEEGAVLAAPPLFESEADSVVRRYVRRGLSTQTREQPPRRSSVRCR